MYSSTDISARIKSLAKSRNMSVKQVLKNAGLNYNTMSGMRTSMPRADNLAKIADCLDCSVDFLLDRDFTVLAEDIPANTYIVAYFDILGSKNEICNNAELLYHCLNDLYNDMVKSFKKLKKITDIRFTTNSFSDNILVCLPFTDADNLVERAALLTKALQYMQFNALFKYSILIRGGISYGNMYINNVFSIGRSLIDAYNIENQPDTPPRIVVPEDIAKKILAVKFEDGGFNADSTIKQDDDKKYYIDYIALSALPELDGAIQQIATAVCNSLDKYKSNEAVFNKYAWVLLKLRDCCKKDNKISSSDDVVSNSVLGKKNFNYNSTDKISRNTVNGNNNIIGDGNIVGEYLTKQEKAILEIYQKLDVIKQAQLLAYAAELGKEG